METVKGKKQNLYKISYRLVWQQRHGDIEKSTISKKVIRPVMVGRWVVGGGTPSISVTDDIR